MGKQELLSIKAERLKVMLEMIMDIILLSMLLGGTFTLEDTSGAVENHTGKSGVKFLIGTEIWKSAQFSIIQHSQCYENN